MYSTTVKVSDIRNTGAPGIMEVEFVGEDKKTSMTVELPKEVITFSKNDALSIQLSAKNPGAVKEMQLKIRGKIIRKQVEDETTVRLSFNGLQSTLKVPKTTKMDFSPMDDVFLVVTK